MGKLYKRGAKFYADYEDRKGIRRRVSLKTSDRKVAKERLRKLELAATNPAAYETQTLVSALQYLLDTVLIAEGKSARTIESYTQKGRHLLRVFGNDIDLRQIERSDVQEFIKLRLGEGASSHTVHKELVVLRRAMRESCERGILDRDPALVIPRFKADYTPKELYLTPTQFESMLGFVSAKRKLWVMLATCAGLRASEVEGLLWKDVHLNEGWIRVAGKKTKTSWRRVPILPQLRSWLEGVDFEDRDGPVVPKWINRRS